MVVAVGCLALHTFLCSWGAHLRYRAFERTRGGWGQDHKVSDWWSRWGSGKQWNPDFQRLDPWLTRATSRPISSHVAQVTHHSIPETATWGWQSHPCWPRALLSIVANHFYNSSHIKASSVAESSKGLQNSCRWETILYLLTLQKGSLCATECLKINENQWLVSNYSCQLEIAIGSWTNLSVLCRGPLASSMAPEFCTIPVEFLVLSWNAWHSGVA